MFNNETYEFSYSSNESEVNSHYESSRRTPLLGGSPIQDLG